MYEAGHVFLARIGKTTLRPGGIEATEWLIDQAAITQETKVLEVACNRGRTMIQLAQRFGCAVTGVDLDENALQNAKANIEKNNLQEKLTLIHGDATALPFEDNSFDVIINEAMLTMLVGDRKDKALKEYFRVLKPGGRVVTQDVFFTVKDAALQKELRMGLSKAINVNVEPLDAEGWESFLPERIYRNTEMRNDDATQPPRFASRRRLVEYAAYYPVRTQERKQSNVFQDVPLLQWTQVRTRLYL